MFGQPVGKSWYFESTTHVEATNRLIYVAEQGEDFVLLTAEHGAGKSTVLELVKSQCSRLGHSTALINVAALDELAFLWHLAGALSINPTSNATRGELMASVREELAGRALCNHRTIVILDDLHLAGADLSLMLQYLSAINQQTDGGVSVVAATEESIPANIRSLSTLKVNLSLFGEEEAQQFVKGMLTSSGVPADSVTEDAIAAIIHRGAGSPAKLTRICDMIQVAHEADERLTITADVFAALTRETLAA